MMGGASFSLLLLVPASIVYGYFVYCNQLQLLLRVASDTNDEFLCITMRRNR